MKVNKLADFLERVGWTFAQAFVGYLIANVAVNGDIVWGTVSYAALIAGGIAAGKVFLAQQFGNGAGDLAPTPSVEPKP